MALPVHVPPLRGAFYAHFLLVARLRFGPFCTNSANGILWHKARQVGKTPQHSLLSVHLADSASLIQYLAGGFFSSWIQLNILLNSLSLRSLKRVLNKLYPEIHTSLSCFLQDDKKLLSYKIKTL